MHEGSDFKLKVIKAANSVLVTFRSAEYAQAVRETTFDLAKQLDAGSTSAQALLRAELRSSHGPAFSAEADELLSSLRQDAEALREKPLRAECEEAVRSAAARARGELPSTRTGPSPLSRASTEAPAAATGAKEQQQQHHAPPAAPMPDQQGHISGGSLPSRTSTVGACSKGKGGGKVSPGAGAPKDDVLVLPRGAAFELQRDTARAKTFRDDLRTFARNFRIQAELVGLDKVQMKPLGFVHQDTREKARAELQNLLNYHFPSVSREREVRLRVAESGAGIDLTPSDRGFQVDHVEEFPGQDFSAGEVILAINGHKLSGLSEDEVEETFGAHFGDGAVLMIGRSKTRFFSFTLSEELRQLSFIPHRDTSSCLGLLRLRAHKAMEAPSGYPDVPPSRPSAAAGMAAADPALGMAAIMENQVEEMRKLLSRFKVCANPAAAGVGADVDAGALPGHADILIFGPSGSGKSSLIRTFYMALHKTQQVPADFADRIIVKDTAMNEGTLKYISAVIKPAKLDHRGNILSSSILCHDTRGQIWMDEREQKQLSVIMDGNVKDDSMVQQRNYRYARLLWEFWKRDSELFPPEILANKRGVHNQPHAVLFVFDGSMEEIPDGEEETKFYREIIQMCREKGYTNPQAASGVEYEPTRGIAMDAWDPLADPADVDTPGKADPTKVSASDGLGLIGDCSAVDDASMLAIAGPLGREAVLSSTRMRDVEDWISRAEASGLDVEQILPARQHLRSLAKQNPTIHWEKRESQATAELVDGTKAGEAEARLQAAEQQVNLLLSDKSSLSAAGNKAMQDAAEQLKEAIGEGYSAGVDLKQLITSRRLLNQLQPKVKQVEPETKQALAKAMLQAMKEKDAVKLGRVLDAAAEAEVKLPGLEAARKKLAEWRTSSPEDSEERSGRTAEVRLRIILPDGRRGWLPVDPEDHGSKVLSSLPQEVTASGDMHFFLGLEASPKGAVTLREEVVFSFDRKVGDQPEFLAQGAALCVCPGRHRSSFESGEDRRSDPTSPLWQSVMRAVSEPFPTFAKVEKLLEDTSGWPAVVLAWGGLEDLSVAERSPEAVQAVGACRVIFTGKVETAVLPSLSVPTTSVIIDDARASSTDIARILGEIEAGGVQRPLLLVVVCRAFLSRRLLQSLRQHLPQDVMLFPCPPATLMRACMEEVPVFESQILEEASRLRSEGVVRLTERCQAALARLQASPEVAVGSAGKKRRVRPVVLTRIDRVEESITKAGGQGASMADREMKLRQVLDKKIEDVCMKLDVPRTAVHFIENYHSGVIGLEQEVRNISVDFHALKILSQCCSHADAFIAQALRDIRAPACAIQ
ncbi:unnamed protein product [Symbiodinium sp. KB8]|nr:unnamed protein product [Symbiodinium sp. KB8]